MKKYFDFSILTTKQKVKMWLSLIVCESVLFLLFLLFAKIDVKNYVMNPKYVAVVIAIYMIYLFFDLTNAFKRDVQEQIESDKLWEQIEIFKNYIWHDKYFFIPLKGKSIREKERIAELLFLNGVTDVKKFIPENYLPDGCYSCFGKKNDEEAEL